MTMEILLLLFCLWAIPHDRASMVICIMKKIECVCRKRVTSVQIIRALRGNPKPKCVTVASRARACMSCCMLCVVGGGAFTCPGNIIKY